MKTRYRYVIESTREGVPTLAALADDSSKIYLHSRYNPARESVSFAGTFNPDKYDVLICLGVGLGYHLINLKDIRKYKIIILIEALPDVEKDIVLNPMTSFLVSSNAIRLLAGMSSDNIGESLYELIESSMEKGLQILEHPASIRAFPEYYAEVKDIIKKAVDRLAGNIATKHTLGIRYIRNICINVPTLPHHRGVNTLFNSMRGNDSIVLTSGPSVERFLPALSLVQDSFYIIAADSALGVASGYGIRPDIVVSIDPQPQIMEHLLSPGDENTIFVHSISSHPSTLSRHKGCISLSTHPLSQLLEEMYPGAVGSVDSSTGTVAGDAVNLAIKMGFKTIILAGFDFSFPSMKIYARGSAYQKRYSLFMQTRTNPVETSNMNYVFKASRGFLYNSLHSRKSFIQYKNGIERLIASSPGTDFRVLAEGLYMPIDGAVAISSENLAAMHPGPSKNRNELTASLASAHRTTLEIINPAQFKKQLRNPHLLSRVIQLSMGSTDALSARKAESDIKSLLEMY
jgi:hypothetical protein